MDKGEPFSIDMTTYNRWEIYSKEHDTGQRQGDNSKPSERSQVINQNKTLFENTTSVLCLKIRFAFTARNRQKSLSIKRSP